MRDEGKVGHLMTLPYTLPCSRAAMETGRFTGLIAPFNFLKTEFADLFDDLQKRSMCFIPFSPLYQGILTDQRANRSALKSDDRCAAPEYTQAYDKLRRLQETFGDEIGPSLTSFAIRFALAHPVVVSVVVGLNNVDQVAGLVEAVEQPMPAADLVDRVRQAAAAFELPEPPHARSQSQPAG